MMRVTAKKIYLICCCILWGTFITNAHEQSNIDINIHTAQGPQDIYYIYLKDLNLYCVLEKITSDNIQDWISFVTKQSQNYGKFVNKYNIKRALPNLAGISLIKKRLANFYMHQLSVHKQDYQMYMTYFTPLNPESKSLENKFGESNSPDSCPIIMMTTIQVSKEFDLYSALGITRTVDEAVRMTTAKSKVHVSNHNKIPVNLYVYSYAILQSLYPHIKAMVSTPVLKVRKIFKKYIPKEYISTDQSLEETFTLLPWVEQDRDSFSYSTPPEPYFFKQPVITRVDVTAFGNMIK